MVNKVYNYDSFLIHETFKNDVCEIVNEEIDWSRLKQKVQDGLKKGLTVGAIVSTLISAGVDKAKAENLVKQTQIEYVGEEKRYLKK